MKITTLDYILIAVGLITLPFFIGLVILGVVMWRVGTRMEKESSFQQEDANASQEQEPKEMTHDYIEEEMEDFAPVFLSKRYKLKQYSEDTLEESK